MVPTKTKTTMTRKAPARVVPKVVKVMDRLIRRVASAELIPKATEMSMGQQMKEQEALTTLISVVVT